MTDIACYCCKGESCPWRNNPYEVYPLLCSLMDRLSLGTFTRERWDVLHMDPRQEREPKMRNRGSWILSQYKRKRSISSSKAGMGSFRCVFGGKTGQLCTNAWPHFLPGHESGKCWKPEFGVSTRWFTLYSEKLLLFPSLLPTPFPPPSFFACCGEYWYFILA